MKLRSKRKTEKEHKKTLKEVEEKSVPKHVWKRVKYI